MFEDHNHSPRLTTGRIWGRRVLAILYFTAGLFHIFAPETFILITPHWVPYPRQVIYVTGICELAGAAALLTQSLRKAAGIAFALYAICVFPANIKHAIDGLPAGHVHLGLWYHIPRLALQPVLVWWALFAGGNISWPFGKRRARAAAREKAPIAETR